MWGSIMVIKTCEIYIPTFSINLAWLTHITPKGGLYIPSLGKLVWRFSWIFWKISYAVKVRTLWIPYLNPRTYMQIHTPTVVQVGGGGELDGTPSRISWYVAVFSNDFTFSGNPLIFLIRWDIFYGWWRCWRPVTSPTMVAILDSAKN